MHTNEIEKFSCLNNRYLFDYRFTEMQTHEGIKECRSIRAGQRKLRNETCVQALNFQADVGCDELSRILVKYGNNPDGIPCLLYAIKVNDLHAVQILLETGASAQTRITSKTQFNQDDSPSNAIEFAAAYSTSEMIVLLESFGAEIDTIEWEFGGENPVQSPMLMAVKFDNIEVFRYLVSRGIKFDQTDRLDGWVDIMPIFAAAINDSIDVFKELINLGVDISTIKNQLIQYHSSNGSKVIEYMLENLGPFSQEALNSALRNASLSHNIKLINILLQHRADPFHAWQNILSQPPSPKKHEIMEIFISHGLNVNKSINNITALGYAAQYGDMKAVQILIKNGAHLNPIGMPNPLHNTNVYRFPEIVKLLIESGVSVNKAYNGGMTPLHYASQSSDPHSAVVSIDMLISAGANINAIDNYNRSPLHLANSDPVIQRLIELNANIHTKDIWNKKPYYHKNLSLEIIKILEKKGVNFNELMDNGVPVFYAYIDRPDYKEIFTFLIEKNKININTPCGHDGATVFHYLVTRGDIERMEFLLNNGANINARNKQGQTPLAIAKQHRQELVCWLIDHGANWNPI